MRAKNLLRVCAFLCVAIIIFATTTHAAEITFSTLLDEMVDRAALSQYPDPAYTCKQFSSYDRRSEAPAAGGWYSNDDYSNFIREETNAGRKEWVMVDAEGPGAVTRWWITGDRYVTTIRIYLDGNAEPTIVAGADELVGGELLCGKPLSADRARGRNLYLPIPYQKSIKITADNLPEQGKFYYAVNYRTYAPGTQVRTFSTDELKACAEKLENVSRLLRGDEENPESSTGERISVMERKARLLPRRSLHVKSDESGNVNHGEPAAVVGLQVKLTADDPGHDFLRRVILKASFDDPADGPQVCCPVSDFFGNGVGINPHRTWYSEVEQDGTMRCFWVMPYKKGFEISLENLADIPVTAELRLQTQPLAWTDRSMYFHCHWRQDRNMNLRRDRCEKDWEFARLEGEGVFVGDVLALWNPQTAWWGEGDEKIYVDGETFPSHHGTGTEDYYGYAWATADFFDAPFHAQPRVEGPVNFGHTTNLRLRALDAIPFTRSFRFDMELWHWEDAQVDYAATVYWYGKPETKMRGLLSTEQMATEVRQSRPYHSPKPLPKLKGFNLVTMTGGNARMQEMTDFAPRTWKDDDQVLWENSKPGDMIEFEVEVADSGTQTLLCELTKAFDFGVFQFFLDGQSMGEPVDLFNPGSLPDCVVPASVVLGTRDLQPGKHRIAVKNVGKNEQSKGMLFGIDTLRFVNMSGR